VRRAISRWWSSRPRIKKEITTTEIKAEEGRRIPRHRRRHAQGGAKPTGRRALPSLRLWAAGGCGGAAPNDTRIYVRQCEDSAALSRRRALRSTVNSDLVRAINPQRPAGYVRRVRSRSSAVSSTIDTRQLRNDRVHGLRPRPI